MSWRGLCSAPLAAYKREPWRVPEPALDDFTYFRGSRTSPLYPYRFLVAMYWTVWLVLSIIGSWGVYLPPPLFARLDFETYYFIFLTNWTMLMVFAYLWCAWLGSSYLRRFPRFLKAVWVLRNLAAMSSVLVTVLYWTLLFPAIGVTNFVDVHCHLVNTVIMLVDLAVSGPCYLLKHLYQPLAYMLAYLLFSLVYWTAGGTDPDGNDYIYPPLDYDHPGQTSVLIVLVVLVLFPLAHWGLWLYARFWARRLGINGYMALQFPEVGGADALLDEPFPGGPDDRPLIQAGEAV